MLTENTCKNAKPKDKDYKLHDMHGLFLFVSKAGAKKWRAKLRVNKKETTISLGDYPAISLKNAREMLFTAKNERKNTVEVQKVLSFEEISLEWFTKKKHELKEDTAKTTLYRLENYLHNNIGHYPINEIQAPHVLEILREFEKRKKFDITHRILSITSQIFTYAIACGYCTNNPCFNLASVLVKNKKVSRSARTAPKDVALLIQNIKSYPTENTRNALLFTAYTFCRSVEVRKAEWKEIDFDNALWTIPAERMKMGKEHKVPLSKQCLEILEQQKNKCDKYIFPSMRPNRCMSDNTMLTALRTLGYAKDEMCVHGFRAMASTLLNELGYDFDVIEKCVLA